MAIPLWVYFVIASQIVLFVVLVMVGIPLLIAAAVAGGMLIVDFLVLQQVRAR